MWNASLGNYEEKLPALDSAYDKPIEQCPWNASPLVSQFSHL